MPRAFSACASTGTCALSTRLELISNGLLISVFLHATSVNRQRAQLARRFTFVFSRIVMIIKSRPMRLCDTKSGPAEWLGGRARESGASGRVFAALLRRVTFG